MENYEKKYKKALEKLQEALAPGEDGCKISGLTRDCLTNIFPELTEDEDENTRKELLAFIKNWKNPSNIGRPSDFPMFTKNKEQCDKYIAWLEKQDRQQSKSVLEVWKNMRLEVYQQASGNRHEPNYSDDSTRMFSLSDIDEIIEKISEQSHNDKTEPKFKVGDCVVDNNSGGVCQVTKIRDDKYCLWPLYSEIQGYLRIIDVDTDYHLWTIADAKDGDVLVTTTIRSCPFIYRKTGYNNNLAYYYAGIDGSGDFCEGCIKRTSYHFGPLSNVVPATKEQHDLLFAKMKKAGYEWDNEKKELKKIESKKLDVWNAEDEQNLNVVLSFIPDECLRRWLQDKLCYDTLDADDILPCLGNNQVQDILEDMGMLDDNGRCPHTAEEIFKAGMEHAFNLNREAASSVKIDTKNI